MEIRTKLITDLPLSEVLGGSEIFPVNQFGVAKKASTQDIIEFTKKQEYATWVNQASTNLKTIDLSTRYLNLYNVPLNQEAFPEFFIGEAGLFSYQGEVSSLSGFKYHYNDRTDRFVFVSYSSAVSANVTNLTAYYIDSNAFMYITNLSTSNTLSARNIYVTDQITISANSNNDALFIVQNGQGNAIEVFDESNDTTPFVVTASGNVGIKTPNPLIDLTIFGNVSSSATLSGRNVHVMERLGVATATPNETLTVFGNISASGVIYDRRLNSDRWFETFTNYSAGSANEAQVATFVNTNSANIRNVNTVVNNTSANWNSVFSHMQANTGSIYAARTYVGNNSANFSDSVSQYNNLSATYAPFSYVNAGFLPLSGGEVSSGTVRISGLTTFGGDVAIVGRLSANLLTVLKTESIPITASTLNVDGSGRFGGPFQLDGQVRVNNNLTVTGFANVSSTITADGIVTSRTYLRDLNGDSRDWNSAYVRWNAVSALDLQVRNFVNPNSANINEVTSRVNNTSSNWDRSFTVTSQTSANWNSNFSTWNANSALDLAARTFVNNNSSDILNLETVVFGTSANWNSAFSTWNANSALNIAARTYVNSNSSNINNVNTVVNNTSANWNSNFSTWNANSALDLAARTFVNNNSSDILNLETVVFGTSANWNSNYSHWNSNSGLIFMTRNFVTTNSANSLNVNTRVNQSSANWNAVYGSFFTLSAAIGEGLTEFQESSARYNRVSTRVEVTSANWNSVYTTFQSNSGKYNSERGSLNIASSGSTIITVPNHTVGFMDIYLNGIKLIAGQDFTETTTSIILNEPTKYNDYKLEYVVYGAYNVANAVSRTGDTMTGSLNVPSLNVTGPFTLPTMVLSRNDLNFEGGELQFARASDNTTKFVIDTFGNGNSPDLRIWEGLNPLPGAAVRLTLQGATGNLGIGNGNPTAKAYIYQDHATQVAAAIQTNAGIAGDALWISNAGNGTGLRIINSGTGSPFVIEDTNNLKTTPFMVNATGQVLLGTNVSPNTTNSIYIESDVQTGGPNGNILIRRFNNTFQTSPNITIGKSYGSAAAPAAVALNDHLGFLSFQGTDTSLAFRTGATIRAEVDGNPTSNAVPSRLIINTMDSAGTQSERVRITSTGRVGINTTTPNQTLTVAGSVSATGDVRITGTFYGDGGGISRTREQNKFWKFKANNNDVGDAALHHRMNSFLTKNGRLYLAGYSYHYVNGKGSVGTSPEYVWPGFHPVSRYNIPDNETIVEHYTFPDGIFVKTNLGNLYGMGRNSRGELGFGFAGQVGAWQAVQNITNVTSFSMANRLQYHYWTEPYPHALAVSNGRLYSWGNNGLGQLGLGPGSPDPVRSPALVNVGAMLNKTNVAWCYAAGDESYNYGHSFVVDTNRKLFACGHNGEGWLGTGNKTGYNEFVAVAPTLNCDKMSSAGWYTNKTSIFLDAQLGKLYGAGMNENGQLGVNPATMRDRSTFAEIPGLSNVIDFAIGGHCNQTGIALLSDRTIRTWGANRRGMLGHSGTTNNHVPTVPTNMQNKTFQKVMVADRWWGADYSSIHALDTEGYLWGTGYNGDARLGLGNTTTDIGLFTRAQQPNDVRFTDFTVEGFAGGVYVTAVDQYGDLWSVGYHSNHSCGSDRPSMIIGNFTRCDIH